MPASEDHLAVLPPDHTPRPEPGFQGQELFAFLVDQRNPWLCVPVAVHVIAAMAFKHFLLACLLAFLCLAQSQFDLAVDLHPHPFFDLVDEQREHLGKVRDRLKVLAALRDNQVLATQQRGQWPGIFRVPDHLPEHGALQRQRMAKPVRVHVPFGHLKEKLVVHMLRYAVAALALHAAIIHAHRCALHHVRAVHDCRVSPRAELERSLLDQRPLDVRRAGPRP